MITSPSSTLSDLYSAVSAHLRGADGDVALILADALACGGLAQMPFAAVMATGEYLREAAEERGMAPGRMLAVLCAAHAELVGEASTSYEDVILSGVRSYLEGNAQVWTLGELDRLSTDPAGVALCSVRVVAAALTWHARDNGADPLSLAQSTCLTLAQRPQGGRG